MRKVITMVGTSLFENFLKEKEVDSNYEYFKENKRRYQELEHEKTRAERLKSAVRSWIEEFSEEEKLNASAEIKSLYKLKEELKEELDIYLLASDTILSYLAGEIIKELLEELEIGNVHLDVVRGLQIWDREEFKEGMNNLITLCYKKAQGFWGNVIINITGGYKATIPYLTILAQVNRCPVYYIFEDTDVLIKIPNIPIDINWNIFREYQEFFRKLEKEKICELPQELKNNEEIFSLIEVADNLASFNPLGLTLWEAYKERNLFVFISSLAEEYIQRKSTQKRIIEKSIKELLRRLKENPKDPDLHHSLKNIVLPKGFNTFKDKQENLQIRILYKTEEFLQEDGRKMMDVYIGLITLGQNVHNAENEYVSTFERNAPKIENLESYKLYKLTKED